ncbi:ABC transporter family substrate-binding protein [Streptomyces capparidis]
MPEVPARPRAGRSAAAALAVALLLPALACCTSPAPPPPASDIGPAPRSAVRDGGTLRWAVDAVPATFNVFQAEASADTHRVVGAVLPALFTLDDRGRPRLNPDYLESAEVVRERPRQVVVYRLNPKARWSGGTRVTAADFTAQWRALSGRDARFWPARNDGYRQIEKVRRGSSDREVRVTFGQPYADWRSLFTPLYPRSVTASPDAFNKHSRKRLPQTAGPYRIKEIDREGRERSLTLARARGWWGARAKLDRVVFTAVPRERRAAELERGALDIAELEPVPTAKPERPAPGVRLRRAPDAAYTQLTLNGHTGPLADERVRRAVARAVDRRAIAESVLAPLGLPARPLGNHLLLAHQDGYKDNSSALGGHDPERAEALLHESGWRPTAGASPSPTGAAGPQRLRVSASPSHGEPGPASATAGDDKPSSGPSSGESGGKKSKESKESKKGKKNKNNKKGKSSAEESRKKESGDGHDKEAKKKKKSKKRDSALRRHVTVVEPATVRVKNGKPFTLRLLVPDRAPLLGTVADRVAEMLSGIGARTEITRVGPDRFFTRHVARGSFDLALFSWPGSAFPATDARSIYAKPLPAPDGSLITEQNFARVGTDEIDQLFEQAAGELDPDVARRLAERADARIWAAAHSLPLYQRPQLVGVREGVANAGAFGFATPRYQDIGFLSRVGRSDR